MTAYLIMPAIPRIPSGHFSAPPSAPPLVRYPSLLPPLSPLLVPFHGVPRAYPSRHLSRLPLRPLPISHCIPAAPLACPNGHR